MRMKTMPPPEKRASGGSGAWGGGLIMESSEPDPRVPRNGDGPSENLRSPWRHERIHIEKEGRLLKGRRDTTMYEHLLKLSRFFNRTFALWIIISGVAGLIIPDVFKQAAPWIPPLLGVVMFGMGLTLSPSDFRTVLNRPKEVLAGVAAQYLVMPLAGWAGAVLFNLPPELAVGLILLGCCPGGTASNVVTFLARGDVALSVTITTATTLLAPLMTPALMYLLARHWIELDAASMLLSILQVVLIPVLLGGVVNRIAGKRLAKVQSALPLLSIWTIMLIAAAIVAKTHAVLLSAGVLVLAAVAFQNAVGLALGWGCGTLLGMSEGGRRALAFEVGMQNAGLGVALAGLHFAASPAAALPSAFGALLHNVTGPALATVLTGRDERKAARAKAAGKALKTAGKPEPARGTDAC